MKIRAFLVAAALAVSVAGSLSATAHPGTAACNGRIETYGSGAATFYIDHRETTLPGDGGGTWVYMEFNGHTGLQTGGDHPVLGDLDNDPCKNHTSSPIASDLLII